MGGERGEMERAEGAEGEERDAEVRARVRVRVKVRVRVRVGVRPYGCACYGGAYDGYTGYTYYGGRGQPVLPPPLATRRTVPTPCYTPYRAARP